MKNWKEKIVDILLDVQLHKKTFGAGYRAIKPIVDNLLKTQENEIKKKYKII